MSPNVPQGGLWDISGKIGNWEMGSGNWELGTGTWDMGHPVNISTVDSQLINICDRKNCD